MNEPKPFASLSSGLLARKGAAKPAMRPQGFGHVAAPAIEDLGWNDMGQAPQEAAAPYPFHDEQPERRPSSISALTPASSNRAASVEDEEEFEAAPETPPVVEQQRAIAATFAPEPVGTAQGQGRRAAGRQGQGGVHAAARCRASPQAAAGKRHRQPVGAADRDRGARRVPAVASRARDAGAPGSRAARVALTPE